MSFTFKVTSDSTAFIHRFSNSLTRKKHRYRHQDYISSMFLAKAMKNNDISALGHFNFWAARGGVHETPNDKCAKMCRRYVGSAIWRRCLKKNPGKLTGEKLQGALQQPPPLVV